MFLYITIHIYKTFISKRMQPIIFFFFVLLDSNSEVWPEKLSITVGIGETVTLGVSTTQSVDTSSLRWRHNGGSEIPEWNGLTSVTIYDVRKSDEGIYECYVEGNRETGKHAILKLIVRSK